MVPSLEFLEVVLGSCCPFLIAGYQLCPNNYALTFYQKDLKFNTGTCKCDIKRGERVLLSWSLAILVI